MQTKIENKNKNENKNLKSKNKNKNKNAKSKNKISECRPSRFAGSIQGMPLPVKRSHASFAINSTAILISTACLLVLGEEYSKYKGHKDFK